MTFNERKAARIAQGQKQNQFVIVAYSDDHAPVTVLGVFNSREEAQRQIDTGKANAAASDKKRKVVTNKHGMSGISIPAPSRCCVERKSEATDQLS